MVLPLAPLAEQARRPPQPTEAFSSAQLHACGKVVDGTVFAAEAPLAVMTYLTDLPRQWLLGQSAAAHRTPLVLVGLGMRWESPAQKLLSARRAAQLVQAVAPQTAIAFADGLDAMVVNAPTARTREAVARIGADPRIVVVGAECNSWPRCYRAQYAKHAAYQACRSTGAAGQQTCYPNSGLMIASGSALLRFYTALHALATTRQGLAGPGGQPDDQAALHMLYLGLGGVMPSGVPDAAADGGGGGSGQMRLSVDSASELLLNLYACKGGGAQRKLGANYTMCHDGAYEPLQHVRPQAAYIYICSCKQPPTLCSPSYAPYTLHLPCTLHPAPCTLHPAAPCPRHRARTLRPSPRRFAGLVVTPGAVARAARQGGRGGRPACHRCKGERGVGCPAAGTRARAARPAQPSLRSADGRCSGACGVAAATSPWCCGAESPSTPGRLGGAWRVLGASTRCAARRGGREAQRQCCAGGLSAQGGAQQARQGGA